MDKTIYNTVYRDHVIRILADRRKSRGLHQYDVSRQVGMGRTWLGKIERCELRLDVMYMVRLCRLYHMSAARLVRRLEKELP